MIGAAAMTRPVSNWSIASGVRSSHHAAMISKNATPAGPSSASRAIVGSAERTQRSQPPLRPRCGRGRHRNRHAFDGDLDHQIGYCPDDAHREEQVHPRDLAYLPTEHSTTDQFATGGGRRSAAPQGVDSPSDIKILDANRRGRRSRPDRPQLGRGFGRDHQRPGFRTATEGKPLLVMANGAHRVDTELLRPPCSAPPRSARPDPARWLRSATDDQVLWRVAPTGHPHRVRTVVDETLAR